MTQMMELLDKDFKVAILNMFDQAIKNSLETNKIKISAKIQKL